MAELKSVEHHVEFVNLPELRAYDLYGLFKLSRYLEPYTNRLVVECDVQVMNNGKVIQKGIKVVGVRSSEIPELIGCSPVTATRLIRTLKEKNIMRRDKDFFINPKYVRAHNGLANRMTTVIFDDAAAACDSEKLPAYSEEAREAEEREGVFLSKAIPMTKR